MVMVGGASWVCLGSSGEAPSLPAALTCFQRRVCQPGDVGEPNDGLGAATFFVVIVVQSLNRVRLSVMAGIPVPHHLLEVTSSCPLNWCCYPTSSSFATLFSFCLQCFPTSGCFPVSWLFTSGGQSVGDSASVSVLPMSIQGLFPLGLTDLISLQFKGLSRVLYNTTIQKHQFVSV